MRTTGHVMGAPATTATRRSVILRAEGSDTRLTLAWTKPAAASAAPSPVSASAPAVPRPSVLKKERRSAAGGGASSIVRTTGFIETPPRLRVSDRDKLHPEYAASAERGSPVRERTVRPPEHVAPSRLRDLADHRQLLHVERYAEPRPRVRIHLAVPEVEALRHVFGDAAPEVVFEHHGTGKGRKAVHERGRGNR